jgi:hypothetical protein
VPTHRTENYKNKDFTDYVLLFVNTGKEHEFFKSFKKLVDNSKSIEEIFPDIFDRENDLSKEFHDEEYTEVTFYDAIKEQYINKPICFRAIVRGEAAKPYMYPKRIRATCDLTRGDVCQFCGLFLTGGNVEINLESINPLELIDCNNASKNLLIKRKLGITQCGQFDVEVLESKYMQELFLSPVVDDVTSRINPEADEKKEQRFIIRHAFSEGSYVIPNKEYKFYCIPTNLPKNQTLIYYIKKAEEQEDDLDNFQLTENDVEALEIFQPAGDSYEDIENKIKEIYRDFSLNLSPIIKYRDDIMLACDLAFHSVLHFWFGSSFEKGWVETLIVGDTSTGKTKVASKLIKHYKLGVVQGAENSTIAGLIGGMTKFETINIMTWGLLPLNNSKLVVLDEMSGIDKQVFSEMTRIRSEGIAERTIVGGSSSTPAKVRLVWLSNPRRRSMRLYDSGCDMIKELVGNEEDISRFDFILTVSSDEISTEKINSISTVGDKFHPAKHIYTSDLCNKLVLWAWSRKATNVKFQEGAERLILYYSIEMSKKYTPNFPLVLGSTIRLKLARLSIALAARLFSYDKEHNDPNTIYVTENHISYIYEFLNRIYNKPSFGYGEYSEYFRTSEDTTKKEKNDIFDDMQRIAHDLRSFIINLLTNPRITAVEIQDFARCDKDRANKLRTKLVSSGFLIKKQGFYVKSDLFRKALKEKMKELDKKEKEETK